MKNTLQGLVRIIIIGSFRSMIECHQQFLSIAPPPYINPPVVEPIYSPEAPVFYPDKTVFSLPFPYQNVDFLSLPQLFFQDQNYRPPSEERNHVVPPSKHYLVPPHQKSYQPPYSPPHKKTEILITHKKVSPLTEVKKNFPVNQKINIRPQKENIYPTLVFKKEKISEPSHQKEISGENLEDDYSYNYSDDLLLPSQSPLLNYPYQHFRPVKPNHISNVQSFSSCSNSKTSHGNLEKPSPDLKTPITFLPSRFPPRIEELLQRIQNYFSTYTQQELQNPTKNITSSSTISESQTTVSESPLPIVSETVDTVSLSKPSENKEPIQVNTGEGIELTTVVEMNNMEAVAEPEKVETILNEFNENKNKEQILTTATDGSTQKLNNASNNAVYLPETTTSTGYQSNTKNQSEIVSTFSPTENFYLSKNSTETNYTDREVVETLKKSGIVLSATSTLKNDPKLLVNHLNSHNQNLTIDLSNSEDTKRK